MENQKQNQNQGKQVNPAKDLGNYVLSIKNSKGEIIKNYIAVNSTISIGILGDQSVVTELK